VMFERLKKGLQAFVDSVKSRQLTEEDLEEPLTRLEFTLLESDVALPVAERIVDEVRQALVGRKVGRLQSLDEVAREAVRGALLKVLEAPERVDLLEEAARARREGDVLRVVLVGPNGHGKTLTAAKLARLLLKHGYSCVFACSDTFRAGAEEQLEEHGRRLGVKVVKHKYGSDPAAVAYDAVAHARARGMNAVIVDTAGRMQTDKPLMDEVRKIVRVVEPQLVIFVGDALTGNDALDQAEKFNSYVGISGSILTKLDADAKGGAAISIAYATRKPILYLGVGQGYDDLIPFDPQWLVDRILS